MTSLVMGVQKSRQLAIDAVALQSLADDLGYEVTHDESGQVRMALTQG